MRSLYGPRTIKTPDSRIYVGRLEDGRPAIYATGPKRLERLETGRSIFEWGADASDAGLAVARALLTDAAGTEPPADVCCRFAQEIVRRLPRDGFALPCEIVDAWLRRAVAV